MTDTLLTTTPPGTAPLTADGSWGVVMLRSSGKSKDSQWFDMRAGFYQPVIRVEWELNTMAVVLPQSIANTLVAKGYARPMTVDEAKQYNKEQPVALVSQEAPSPPPPPREKDPGLQAIPVQKRPQDLPDPIPVAKPEASAQPEAPASAPDPDFVLPVEDETEVGSEKSEPSPEQAAESSPAAAPPPQPSNPPQRSRRRLSDKE